MKPVVIGLAGPSCSGKTEIARLAAAALRGPVLTLDSYYRDLSHLTPEQRAAVNFDAPEALREDLVLAHVAAMAEGQAIEKPVYDFARHCASGIVERMEPSAFVIVEGLFTLAWKSIRQYLTLTAFVSASHEVCLERRLMRDTSERGRSPESVREQYKATVRPMCDLHVNPSRHAAELLLDGERPLVDSVNQLLDAIWSKRQEGT